jgi:large subunit ribosomal protein L6
MSRIGKKPITIPSGVKVQMVGTKVSVQGPKGKLETELHPRIKVTVAKDQVEVSRATDIRTDRALHGLVRSLINNMIIGVTEGYKKELEMEGVGFKGVLKGNVLTLTLGFSHPIEYQIPQGITIVLPKPTQITVTGNDKQMVGQVAAEIRLYHKPEPYKGKGIHYVGEHIRRKQGKTVG